MLFNIFTPFNRFIGAYRRSRFLTDRRWHFSDKPTFEEVIENAPGNFYMRSRFLLRRLQEGCPLLLSKSDPGQPRGAAEDPGPGAASVWAWSLDVVDHQHFNLAFDCLQPEPELFL